MATEAVPASVTAEADSGRAFLEALAGDWRGTGDAKINPMAATTRITCKLTAVFDPAQSILSNSGRCGTTQGSQEVEGSLAAVGDTLKGEFIAGVETDKFRKQTLRLVDDRLVVEAEMDNEQGGKVHRLRTVLTKPTDGAFVVQNQFYDWDKATWIVGGEINFQKQ